MTTNAIPTIKCSVVTHYIEDQSEPENQRYVFSYTITIRNLGSGEAQLLNRHWLITDANGKKNWLLTEKGSLVSNQKLQPMMNTPIPAVPLSKPR